MHFPFFQHVILRDEFNNICPQDGAQLSVRLSGCSLRDVDASLSPDRNGGYSISFIPHTSGEVRFTVLVHGEVLVDKPIIVR